MNQGDLKNIKIHPVPTGKARLKIPVSIVKGARNKVIVKQKLLKDILNEMVDKSNHDLITLTKQLHEAKSNDLRQYKKLKEEDCKGLIIGEYSTRKDDDCQLYIPLIGFDIDALEDQFTTSLLLHDCRSCPHIFLAFPSPSGRGLRIFIWCDATPQTHKEYYKVVCEMLSDHLRIKTDKVIRTELKAESKTNKEISGLLKSREHIDTGTNNISRLWFYSHLSKEDIYHNESSKIFKIPSPAKSVKTKRPQTPNVTAPNAKLDLKEKIRLCVKMAETRNNAAGRNNSLYPLACVMWEHGIEEKEILAHCLSLQDGDFSETEITKTVKSAIKRATFKRFSDEQMVNWRAKVEGVKRTTDKQPKPDAANNTSIIKEDNGGKESNFVLIKRHLSRKYDFRLNTIANEIEYRHKSVGGDYKDLNENDLICELLELGFNGVENKLIALLRSSFVPSYNPIQNYFNNLTEWDQQTDHINQLAGYIKVKDQDWFDSQFKKMLVRSVACALGLIPFNKQCFTLKGKQNDGKTSFIRFLCPPPLIKYYKEDIDITSKDGRLALCQNMFINFDELDGLSRYEINKVKALFTTDTIKERLPYDKKPRNFKRIVNFFGTTNREEILTDETGNVRWLIFEVLDILHDNGGINGYNQNINIDDVYAQAYSLLKSRFNFKLTPDEIDYSENKNKGYLVQTAEQGLIEEYIEPATKDEPDAEFMSTTMIMEALKEVSKTTLYLRNVGKALKILGYIQYSKKVKGEGSRKRYCIKKTESYHKKIAANR